MCFAQQPYLYTILVVKKPWLKYSMQHISALNTAAIPIGETVQGMSMGIHLLTRNFRRPPCTQISIYTHIIHQCQLFLKRWSTNIFCPLAVAIAHVLKDQICPPGASLPWRRNITRILNLQPWQRNAPFSNGDCNQAAAAKVNDASKSGGTAQVTSRWPWSYRNLYLEIMWIMWKAAAKELLEQGAARLLQKDVGARTAQFAEKSRKDRQVLPQLPLAKL